MVSLKKERVNIGILLLMSATAVSNLLGIILNRGMATVSDLLMIVALILITDFASVFRGVFYRKSISYYFLLGYIVIISLWSIFEGKPEGAGAPIYNLFAVAFMILLMTNSEWKNSDKFASLAFYYFGFLAIFSAYYLTNGFTNISQTINSVYDANGNIVSNRLTLSGIPLYSMVCCIVYKSESKLEKVFKAIFIIFAIVAFFVVNKRAQMIDVLLVLIANYVYNHPLRNKRRVSVEQIIRAIIVVLGTIILMLCAMRIDWFASRFNEMMHSLINAIGTLLGSTQYGYDDSAATRHALRGEVFSQYSSFTEFEIFFGRGYMYKYLDFPLLQAFIDSGIFGGILFVVGIVLIPIRGILVPSQLKTQRFIQMMLIIGLIDLTFNGIPYGIDRYLMVILTCFYYNSQLTSNYGRSNRLETLDVGRGL